MGVGWVARNIGGLYYTFFHGDYFINHENFRIPPTSRFNGNVLKGLNTRIKQPGFNENNQDSTGLLTVASLSQGIAFLQSLQEISASSTPEAGTLLDSTEKLEGNSRWNSAAVFLFVGRRDPFDDPCFGWKKKALFLADLTSTWAPGLWESGN